jgi:nicotinamidase-related amidase
VESIQFMTDSSKGVPGPATRRDVLLVIDVQGQPAVNVQTSDGRPAPPDDPAVVALMRKAQIGWARMLGAISPLIADARSRGTVIMFLEDAKVPHPTHPALWHALGATPAVVVRKYLNDGAPVALSALSGLGIDPGDVLVCGALTEVCVRETVLGLRRALGRERIRVAPGACFDEEWDEETMGRSLTPLAVPSLRTVAAPPPPC